MLLLASRTFNSLMTQVMLPILASIWCVCSVVGRRRVVIVLHHVLHLHHLHHHLHCVHLGVSVVGEAVAVPLHLVHHPGKHGGHVVDMFVVVALVDHSVGESVGRPIGGKGELRSILMAALGNGLLHVDHDKLHVLLAPAALHGLQLLPLLDHFIVHATDGNGGQRENHEQLHAFYVSLQGSC